jgi:hypothetical protein
MPPPHRCPGAVRYYSVAMSTPADNNSPSLLRYFCDAGLAVWGAFGVMGALIGSALNLEYVSDVPLIVWVLVLAVCLVLAPARAHHKQEQRHAAGLDKRDLAMRKKTEANRALWYYGKLRAMESEIRAAMHRLPTGTARNAPVYESFVKERLSPWVEQLQLFASGTKWDKTDLSHGIADNDPDRDFGSIVKYVGNKSALLEAVHNEYEIIDEHDL